MIFGGLLAATLTALVIFMLHVPMLGTWVAYTAVIADLVVYIAGHGFRHLHHITNRQPGRAVFDDRLADQHLLQRLLHRSTPLTRLAYTSSPGLLPATYGTALLQDIMLRGLPPEPLLLHGPDPVWRAALYLCLVAPEKAHGQGVMICRDKAF